MEETKNTENFDEVLDENEEVEIEEPAKESKFKKAVSKAKDKIKNVKVTTVLKAVAVGAGLVAAYTLGSRHVEDEDGAVAENDYVELEDLSGDSGESKETEEYGNLCKIDQLLRMHSIAMPEYVDLIRSSQEYIQQSLFQ